MAQNKIKLLHFYIYSSYRKPGWLRFHTGEPELLLKGYLKVAVQNIKPKILIIEYMLEQIMVNFNLTFLPLSSGRRYLCP